MQPPPQRKAKILQQLKNVQNEHLAKLQQKYQFELEFLEDMRMYMKQRAAIDKDYAQAMQKLNSQHLQKHEWPESSPNKSTQRSPLHVWKVLLEETEKLAKDRLTVSDTIQTQIAEHIKSLRAAKGQAAKKSQELAMKIHDEITASVRNLTKSRKEYIEQEKLASTAREQAVDAEDRLKKRAPVKFYRSKAQLEKNVSKTTEKKDACEVRCTLARNEYILQLVAANAHMARYFDSDIKNFLQMQDYDFYNRVKEYLSKLGTLETDINMKAADSYKTVHAEAEMISGEYNTKLFLQKNKVFTEKIAYKFEPCEGDQTSKISRQPPSAETHLLKEAKWIANRYAQDSNKIKEKKKSLRGLVAVSTVINKTEDASTIAESKQEADQTTDDLKEEIRLLEIQKLKAEAQLQELREAGVKVDDWIQHRPEPEDVQIHEVSSSELMSSTAAHETWDSRFREDSFDDDMTLDDDEWDPDSTYGVDSDEEESQTNKELNPLPCVALFDYEATSPDELTIREHDELEIWERDGEGWCKGKNKNGDVGFFPESYVEVTAAADPSRSRSPSVSTTNSATGSCGSSHSPSSSHNYLPETAAEEAAPAPQHICVVRALYDYEALNEDEISFNEGDIIKVLKKDDDTDDGFWEGIVDNMQGFFPCVLVEETADVPPEEEPIYSVAPCNKPAASAGTPFSSSPSSSSSPKRSSQPSSASSSLEGPSRGASNAPPRPPPPSVIPSASLPQATTAGEYVFLSGRNEAQDNGMHRSQIGRVNTVPHSSPRPPRARFSSNPKS